MSMWKPFVFTLFGLFYSAIWADVEVRDTVWVYQQYYVELAESGYHYPKTGNYVDASETALDSVIQVPDSNAKVIENEYYRVVVSPLIGGRVMSMFHKPSGTEQLYHAPTAAPYTAQNTTFWWNYLIVYGGILPTFPDPEHGRTWNQPWELKVIKNESSEGVVQIQYSDTTDHGITLATHRYRREPSNLNCIVNISLKKGEAVLHYDVSLQNPTDKRVTYEYWTLTTLSPGSDPHYTYSPKNTLILAPNEEVHAKNDWWPWMGGIDNLISEGGAGDIFTYKNFSLFENWDEEGILYAYPNMKKDWWGAINLDHQNKIGILRVADNKITKGMKYWTWGMTSFQEGSDEPVDLHALTERKPHIELWGGHSNEFFRSTSMSGDEEVAWSENYFATFGLDTVHYANEYGALEIVEENGDVSVKFSTIYPEKEHVVTLNMGDKTLEVSASADANGAGKAVFTKDNLALSNGTYNVLVNIAIGASTIEMPSGEVAFKYSGNDDVSSLFLESELPVFVQGQSIINSTESILKGELFNSSGQRIKEFEILPGQNRLEKRVGSIKYLKVTP